MCIRHKNMYKLRPQSATNIDFIEFDVEVIPASVLPEIFCLIEIYVNHRKKQGREYILYTALCHTFINFQPMHVLKEVM